MIMYIVKNKRALIAISYIKGSFDAGVDGGGGWAQDIWGHERVGGQLAVVLQPGVVTQATHLNPLVWVNRQQLCRNRIQINMSLNSS